MFPRRNIFLIPPSVEKIVFPNLQKKKTAWYVFGNQKIQKINKIQSLRVILVRFFDSDMIRFWFLVRYNNWLHVRGTGRFDFHRNKLHWKKFRHVNTLKADGKPLKHQNFITLTSQKCLWNDKTENSTRRQRNNGTARWPSRCQNLIGRRQFFLVCNFVVLCQLKDVNSMAFWLWHS